MLNSFHEIQRFNKWWHYLIAGLPVVITVIAGIFFYLSMPPSDDLWTLIVPGAVILFTALTFLWFLFMKLETTIDPEGIRVQFHGIPFCKRSIAWSEIKHISVISYSPLSDYGGWGVRYGMAGNGWCYNISGNTGIKLFYQNEKPFLIGTQDADAARHAISHYFKS